MSQLLDNKLPLTYKILVDQLSNGKSTVSYNFSSMMMYLCVSLQPTYIYLSIQLDLQRNFQKIGSEIGLILLFTKCKEPTRPETLVVTIDTSSSVYAVTNYCWIE